MPHQQFLEAIQQLGRNDAERANFLGVTARTLTNWRRELPEPIARLMRAPELLDALAADARDCYECGSDQPTA